MKNFLKLSNNFFIILFCFSNAQDKMDKAIYPCGYGLSANRWLGTESSLTENQSKIDVTFYRIKLEIDIDEKEIIGSVLVNGLIGMDQPDSIEFDLAQGMTVDSVKLYNELHFFVHTDNLVKIPRPDVTVPEGYEFSVEVFYHGNPEPTGFGSFNFDTYSGIDHIWTLSEPYGARDWWPCKDDPSDKADSAEIIVIVPEEQVVVSNGLLIDEIELNNGVKQYHWQERYPISTYLVSITSYPYMIWHDQYIGINGDTLPLDFYVYPDHYDDVYNNYLYTNDMMEVFADLFGEYPFMGEKYGHVEFGRGGGMEHQTISSLGGYSKGLIAHELGHQWWGNLLTCASFHHIWLNEGFARYCESIWKEHYYGKEAYNEFWEDHAYYGPGTIYVENPVFTNDIFNGNLSYDKGGWVVHMLRGVLGDSLFFHALKSYAYNDSLKYGAVTTEDFQTVCEDISGLDLGDFFNQWIYGERYPQYAISWEKQVTDELIITIDQTQDWQYFAMPIDLRIIIPNDTLDFILENSGGSQSYNLGVLSSSSFNVILDPDGWILKEVEYLNNGYEIPGPTIITLNPAYPNPFNNGTNISFFIPETVGESNASVQIYDLQGRLIETIWSGKSIPGINNYSWLAYGKSSGLYFIRLGIEDRQFTQKVQYIK